MHVLTREHKSDSWYAGLAFLQNRRSGHYAISTEAPHPLRVAVAFTELASAI